MRPAILIPLLAAAAFTSANHHFTGKLGAHQALLARQPGNEAMEARNADNPQPGEALKAIPKPKIIPQCSKQCVYVTAPSNVNVVYELDSKNFTVDANTVAYQLGFGQANTFGIQPTPSSFYGILVGFEKEQSFIIMATTGPDPKHTLIGRFDEDRNGWTGPPGFGTYSYTGSDSNYQGNVYLKFV
ncbi:hypothetical protein OC834_000374 [Tilletia horrida]|uniref:Uncharacterized protein n=1 Tax=Tilletia horrida TaxID=155126 RepID=A0AAN6JNQ4_9BASI|nr:hypothetical protein OC835_006334 [Tilletia horrida]KAK0523691.1 hypothetical protein OC842_006066 [Tilletia horrida]KAK0538660.1 hypothetical protein OC834_000374 [Tilletia horrida]KAK0560308.1 hypothetical protein OC844_003842 [Tilletia horrida]